MPSTTANPTSPISHLAVAIHKGEVLRTCLVSMTLTVVCCAGLWSANMAALATLWLVMGLVDLQPLLAASVLRSTTNFAFAWMAAALVRMPAGLLVASWLGSERVNTALPFAYLASVLLSAILAARIISRSWNRGGDDLVSGGNR